ncbi:glucoamylase family protein [Ideonella sp. BN130291]|uniref:glucoamylase family protein n=1 Tax=Ideonella sp. BN130291 TaxID=3112940 RepID=UPI002E26BD89|nr:glucoamylase family protein [Ideonella sp. BN130291]
MSSSLALLLGLGLAVGFTGCQISGSAATPATVEPVAVVPHPALPPLFDDIERRTFNFFWETANPTTGLVPDRWPSSPHFASIASVGFALTAYVDGVERRYVSRAQARDRVLTTARFFANAPQGPQATGTAGHQGFFYHWLDARTGLRYDSGVELSTVDTSLLLAGLLFAQQYFDGQDPGEAEIRTLVDRIYQRVDWRWAQVRSPLISMGWKPESGFIPHDYRGYDEAMIVYLLALGSPTHAVEPAAWTAFTATYGDTWGTFQGQQHLGGAPLFWHQYSHVWVDFRGIRDAFMRGKGLDYFENSRRATLAQRQYAIHNPQGWREYGADVWGLTACDGPGTMRAPDWQGRQRQFHDYRARGAGLRDSSDDGTIAPTAALGSLPFAPEVVIPAAQAMHQRYGSVVYGQYGFLDAFNRSFTLTDVKLSNGRVVAGWGWVDTDYLGIDQGPIIGMIANYRDELVWKHMRKHPALRRGLERAGFTGGWLAAQ